MRVAIAYPDPTPGKRTDLSTSPETGEVQRTTLSQARLIVREAPDLVDQVIAGHGGWLPWLDREFGWSDQTAHNYMNLYKAISDGRLQIPNDLEFEARALYLLARKSTPQEVRDEIIEQAADGKKFTLADVERMIREAKVLLGF